MIVLVCAVQCGVLLSFWCFVLFWVVCCFVFVCGVFFFFFFFQAEDGIRDWSVTGVQTCALPIFFCSRSSGGFRNARGGLSIDCTRAPLTLQLASPGCGRESATRRVRNLLSAGRYRSKRWKARAGIHAECGSLHGNGVILPRIRERLGISCPA